MKIAYIADANSIHTQRWANYFAGKGHEVHIISTRPPALPGVNVHRIGCTGFKLLSDMVSLFQCKRLLKRIKPDLVHAHFITGYGFLGALMSYHPFIVSVWGSDVLIDPKNSKLTEYALRYTLKKADAITCTSPYLYKATLPYAPQHSIIKIIPFGIDLGVFKLPSKPPNRPGKTIGTLKRLDPVYGIDYLIRSIPHIRQKHKDVRILIAGYGNQKPYQQAAQEIGVEKNVEFIGTVPHAAVTEYLSRLDIFVMPSLSEAFGVSALEAQALGIPVVATNIGGIPEIVKDGESGLLVEPQNPKAIADAIIRLLDDEALRKRMGARGRKLVEEKYDWNENAKEMEALYSEFVR
ncbi:glycosyltransferase [Chloroflexota bacterium]